MDEIRPLLSKPPPEGADVPHLNLRPRHQDLIPTPCGPVKRWSELTMAVQLYFCFTMASLCVLLGLTVASLCGQYDAIMEEDFAVSLILLVGILFCVYYVARGVLQDNRQELCAFLLSVLTMLVRSVVNYCLLQPQEQQRLVVRFVCILCLGVVQVVSTCLLLPTSDRMAFRVGGALQSLQEKFFLLKVCFSMVTFDLQAQLCLCILVTSVNATSLWNSSLLGCALFWSCLTTAVGVVALMEEARVLVLVFVLQNIPEVAFFIYIMYTIISRWLTERSDGPHTLEAASIVGALVSVAIKTALLGALARLDKHFRPGPRDERE